ncbi:hypothetical protein M9H77_19447 [Catharanthus roseus]|uniref:Uncharacterized protein n=1 Tax=Catharanthus roseus TaxID=4058 RepID=A0ACC0BAE8_CATRO|nr:hypothetical protein M9H77_19447 [Catharanthus roseus]
MAASCFSVTSLYGKFLRRSLIAAGLSSQTIDIDEQTTMHFWGPQPNSNPSSSAKPSLLLIHGFGPHHGVFQWRPQIVFFAADFDIYVPDLVFFGHSTTTSNERSEVFQAICVGKLMEKLGVNKYSVVGTSYGGFVAYNLALMFPERIQKLVIANSGINMRKEDHQELLKRANVEKVEDVMLPETSKQLKTLIKLAVYRSTYMPNFVLKDMIGGMYMENRKEKMELLRGLTIGRDDTANIKPLQQDVLLIWGDHDRIFPLDKGKELKEIFGEKAWLEVIKDTSHIPQIEQAGIFNNLLKEFLA